ncbi:hypothetical protein BH18ACT17_BH18ACT17_07360 [soil metagenome]
MNDGIEGTIRDQADGEAKEPTGVPDAAVADVKEAARAVGARAMASTIWARRAPVPQALGRVAPGGAAAWVVAEAWVAGAAWVEAEVRQAGEA